MKPEHLHVYMGNLELYFETGMECMGTIFHDDRGLHPGPKYDKPEETMMYKSLAWSIFFGDRMCYYDIRIFDKDNKILYDGPLVKDKLKMKRDKYRLSFIPAGLSRAKWLKYCQNEYRAHVRSNYLVDALQQQYEIKYATGTSVVDEVSKRNAVVIGHILTDEKRNAVNQPLSLRSFRYLIAIIEDGKLPKTYQERAPTELSPLKWPNVLG